MAVAPTYPGVYIQEIPSGAGTITGVGTSISAFIGRARRGPVDEPVALSSFADFERAFGGLWSPSALTYAVRDFFLNGGSQAVVVRVYEPPASGGGSASLTIAGLQIEATDPGSWGNAITASVDDRRHHRRGGGQPRRGASGSVQPDGGGRGPQPSASPASPR